MRSRSIRKTHNEHLRDLKVATEYINHAFDSEDLSIILMAIRNVVEAQEGGIAGVAERAELGRESVYKILSPKGNPKLSTLSSLFHGLGMKIAVYPELDAIDTTLVARQNIDNSFKSQISK